MRHVALLAVTVGALSLFAVDAAPVQAAEERVAEMVPTAAKSKRVYRKRQPMEVTIYPSRRRIGGYSYGGIDSYNTYGASPPPYTHTRQTPSGPFDNGFFFSSGGGPYGGDSVYNR